MTGKQNFIFFLGLTLIVLNFWLGGQFGVLAKGIFGTSANTKNKNGQTQIPTQNILPGLLP